MKIMSERRFKEELEKVKEEIYQQEQLDRRFTEINNLINEIHRNLYDLRCKVDGNQDTKEVNAR